MQADCWWLQVPLVELPGLLSKCRASVGADLATLSLHAGHACGGQPAGASCCHLSFVPRGLDFWQAAFAKPGFRADCWEEAQRMFAAAACARSLVAPLLQLVMFAEQLLENAIAEDEPITVWVMEAIHGRYHGSSGGLCDSGATLKQFATAMKTLAWAGLASRAVVAALGHAMRCSLREGDGDPPLPPSHLADVILQVADAGAIRTSCTRQHASGPQALLGSSASIISHQQIAHFSDECVSASWAGRRGVK